MDDSLKILRKNTILEKIILCDGQPGNGKSMFGALISSFNDVEHVRYSYALEQICALNYLRKISLDVAELLIKHDLDNIIYDVAMGKNLNFRYNDITSIFKSVNKIQYIKRLFSKGDMHTTKIISDTKPILNLIVHNFMVTSLPLFNAYENKVFLLDIVRHPLYMIIQQHLFFVDHFEQDNQKRNFTVMIEKDSMQIPFWNYDNDKYKIKSNSIDKVIAELYHHTILQENFRKKYKELFTKQILTIPFENFVLDPMPYIDKVKKNFEITPNNKTLSLMKKHKLPRTKLADGLALLVYKRCGWEPPRKNLSEKDELQLRKDYVIQQSPSKESLELLDYLIKKYNEKYFSSLNII